MLTITRSRGNALAETMVALLALVPFIGGIVLLGKQLDVKHKSFDALRYSVWERTVWSARGNHAKSDADITVEALDRSFGNPEAGLLPIEQLRAGGVSQNPFWRDGRQALLTDTPGAAIRSDFADGVAPVDAGYIALSALAHGDGPLAVAAQALQMDDLSLNRRAFTTATIEANLRPVLAFRADHEASNPEHAPLTQRATGAVLSDTWSSRDEREFSRRVDNVTANELIETLELPGRPIAMQSLSKGGPLYGEGQYGWDPDFRPRSNTLPSAYITEREAE